MSLTQKCPNHTSGLMSPFTNVFEIGFFHSIIMQLIFMISRLTVASVRSSSKSHKFKISSDCEFKLTNSIYQFFWIDSHESLDAPDLL